MFQQEVHQVSLVVGHELCIAFFGGPITGSLSSFSRRWWSLAAIVRPSSTHSSRCHRPSYGRQHTRGRWPAHRKWPQRGLGVQVVRCPGSRVDWEKRTSWPWMSTCPLGRAQLGYRRERHRHPVAEDDPVVPSITGTLQRRHPGWSCGSPNDNGLYGAAEYLGHQACILFTAYNEDNLLHHILMHK